MDATNENWRTWRMVEMIRRGPQSLHVPAIGADVNLVSALRVSIDVLMDTLKELAWMHPRSICKRYKSWIVNGMDHAMVGLWETSVVLNLERRRRGGDILIQVKAIQALEQYPDDADLLRLIARGDPGAFSEFYDRVSTPLFSLACRILQDPKESEDVIQEVFLHVWGHARTFDSSRGKPFSWMATLTRNKAIDRLRSRQRRFRLLTEASNQSSLEPAAGASSSEEMVLQEKAALVRSMVTQLPEDQRQAIEMAFFQGLTHFEIADKLQQPLGTIKARIRRGMIKLRDHLEGRL